MVPIDKSAPWSPGSTACCGSHTVRAISLSDHGTQAIMSAKYQPCINQHRIKATSDTQDTHTSSVDGTDRQICAMVPGRSGLPRQSSHLVRRVLLQHLRELFMRSALTGGFTRTLYDILCGMYAVSLKYLFGCSCFFRLTNIWS